MKKFSRILFPLYETHIVVTILLLLFLLFPIFCGGRFASILNELSWTSTNDIFILSWSCGITSLFICLIFFEIFRETLRFSYLYLFILFFTLGISDIAYSVFSMEFKNAIWFKAAGALSAGMLSVLSLFFQKKYSYNYLFDILKSLLFALILLLLLSFIPFSGIKIFLPAYDFSGSFNSCAIFFFSLSALFFIIAAIPWLNNYLNQKQTGRDDLVIGVFFIFLGVLFAFSKHLNYSSFFWWLWHFSFLILYLFLALYLTVACIRRSFVWKIVLSVCLLFFIAILASFWAVRKYYDNRERIVAEQFIFSQISSKHEKYIERIDNTYDVLQLLSKYIDGDEQKDFQHSLLKKLLEFYFNLISYSHYDSIGIVSPLEMHSVGSELSNNLKENISKILGELDSGTILKFIEEKDGLTKRKFLVFFNKVNENNGLFCVLDASFITARPLIENYRNFQQDWGKIIFDTKKAKIIYSNHPPIVLKNSKEIESEFTSTIVSLAYQAKKKKNKTVAEFSPLANYMFFAIFEPNTQWLLIDYSYGEPISDKSALKVHMIVSMSAMLSGLVIMLLLLNSLLSKPLKKVMIAATSLQNGNFDYRTHTRREDEIGSLEHIIDQTSERLKILYDNLKMTIIEKENALLKIQKIEKEKRDFFNGLSHELKSPIHSIVNFSKFGMNSTTATIKEYFEKINECSMILLNIIEELLQISRLEAIPKSIISAFSMKVAINECIWNLSTQSRVKEVKIVTNFEPMNEEFTIFADKSQIAILLSNIIGNAIKYTERKTVISVFCKKENDMITLRISDQGPGIPPKEMNKLFREFVRLSHSKESGTGLGLYISKKIVENHGGTIYAVNNPNKGVAFIITLPVRNEKKN